MSTLLSTKRLVADPPSGPVRKSRKLIRRHGVLSGEQYDEDRVKDLVECIHRMEDLLDSLKANDKLRYIADDGAGDVALWNKEIARYFRGKDL